MQQAIYQNITARKTAIAMPNAGNASRQPRRFAAQWDLYGVLALIASSVGYGAHTLLHLV